LRSFRYVKPQSLEEFGDILRTAEGRTRVLAGGTHLIKEIKQGQVQLEWLIDIKGIDGLKEIHYGARSGLSMGANTTLSEIIGHSDIQKHYPFLVENSAVIPSWQIRNRATLGGEIRTASIHSPLLAALLCYDASCRVLTNGKEQTVALTTYLQDISLNSQPPDHLITTILLPPHTAPLLTAYNAIYHDRGRRILLAGAAVAAMAWPDGHYHWWVVMTGVTPYLRRLSAVEDVLAEQSGEAVAIDRATALLATLIQPEDDLHTTASYRMAMAGQLFQRSVHAVMQQIQRGAS